MATAFANQIQNRNFLTPVGFKFTLGKYPKVDFLSMSANIPDISLATQIQPSYLKDIDVPGDKLVFGDFNLKFLVDEDLKNYMEIQNWMRGLGFPENVKEIIDLQNNDSRRTIIPEKTMDIYSDGSLMVLTSNNNINFKVNFQNMFPSYLSTLDFDATDTDVQYFTADVTFKYTLYNITDENNKRL